MRRRSNDEAREVETAVAPQATQTLAAPASPPTSPGPQALPKSPKADLEKIRKTINRLKRHSLVLEKADGPDATKELVDANVDKADDILADAFGWFWDKEPWGAIVRTGFRTLLQSYRLRFIVWNTAGQMPPRAGAGALAENVFCVGESGWP